jgi:hypothetical protein
VDLRLAFPALKRRAKLTAPLPQCGKLRRFVHAFEIN